MARSSYEILIYLPLISLQSSSFVIEAMFLLRVKQAVKAAAAELNIYARDCDAMYGFVLYARTPCEYCSKRGRTKKIKRCCRFLFVKMHRALVHTQIVWAKGRWDHRLNLYVDGKKGISATRNIISRLDNIFFFILQRRSILLKFLRF